MTGVHRTLDRIKANRKRIKILPPATFTIKGKTYKMDGGDIEDDVIYFFDENGKHYKADYDTLVDKIMEDMEKTGRKEQ